MSLRGALAGVSWNLVAGATAGAAIVFATPWYVGFLGLEGFGVVGLWLTLQLLVGFLDLGFGAALMRSLASSTGQAGPSEQQVATARSLESVALLIAAALGLVLVLAAEPLLDGWLRWREPRSADLVPALRLLGLSIALQFPSLLYSSGLLGLHRHRAVATLQGGSAALRHGGGVLVLAAGFGLKEFFAVQVLVSAVQTIASAAVFRAALGNPWRGLGWIHWPALRALLSYSTGMAVTSLVAVALGNADRILASRLLSPEAFGSYAVAFTAAGLLQLGIQPFYRTYFPRFTQAISSGDPNAVATEYFAGSRLLGQALVPIAVTVVWFAPDILRAWVGNTDAQQAGVLRWLTLGVAMSGLGWLPAALQQAHGWTRLHSSMMALSLVVGTAAAWFSFSIFGARAATLVWLVHGATGLTLELALMHRRILRGSLFRWYEVAVFLPLAVSLPVVSAVHLLRPEPEGRLSAAFWSSVALLLGWAATFLLARRTATRTFISPATP